MPHTVDSDRMFVDVPTSVSVSVVVCFSVVTIRYYYYYVVVVIVITGDVATFGLIVIVIVFVIHWVPDSIIADACV